jgi:hypothetical protein
LEMLELVPDLSGVNRFGGERAWTPDLERRAMEIALTLNPPNTKNAKQRIHADRVREYINNLGAV